MPRLWRRLRIISTALQACAILLVFAMLRRAPPPASLLRHDRWLDKGAFVKPRRPAQQRKQQHHVWHINDSIARAFPRQHLRDNFGATLLPVPALTTTTPSMAATSRNAMALQNYSRPDINYTCTMTHTNHNNVTVHTVVSVPPIPQFIVAGAQKAGTSALAVILRMHPHTLPSPQRETHFFDFLPDAEWKTYTASEHCALQSQYARRFNHTAWYQPAVYPAVLPNNVSSAYRYLSSFEKTPAYFCHFHVPKLIAAVCPWLPKIIIVLRNPIDRAYSHYRMSRENWQSQYKNNATVAAQFPSFAALVQQEVLLLNKLGITNAPLLNETTHLLQQYNDAAAANATLAALFRPSTLSFINRTGNNEVNRGILARGMYAQQLHHWQQHFPLDTKLRVIRYEHYLHHKRTTIKAVWDWLGIPVHRPLLRRGILEHDYSPTRYHYGRDPMPPHVRRYLGQLYQVYNDELADMLGDDWRNVWT